MFLAAVQRFPRPRVHAPPRSADCELLRYVTKLSAGNIYSSYILKNTESYLLKESRGTVRAETLVSWHLVLDLGPGSSLTPASTACSMGGPALFL